MDFSAINWLAVVACVVASMVSGFVWYHPKVFFSAWLKEIGKTEGEMSYRTPEAMIWVLTVLSAFVQATATGFMLSVMGSNTLGAGALAGFMIWLGFVAPTNLVNKLFAGHSLKVWAIEAGNHLVNLLLFGAILAAWQ
ncbi:MAG: DUF1761 domain-containing protein [Chloroflexota bacterium]